jgi:copper(I)-binding protein
VVGLPPPCLFGASWRGAGLPISQERSFSVSISFLPLRRALVAAFTLLAAGSSWAQLSVQQPWARATVPSQKSSGAFMVLNAPDGARLTGVSTPVAGIAEIHEMKMDGDVMRMRAIQGLDLPAGQTVELKPGGYHLMLMGLKQQLKEGEVVPLTLHVTDAAGQSHAIALQVPVRALSGHGAPASAGPQHGQAGAASHPGHGAANHAAQPQ